MLWLQGSSRRYALGFTVVALAGGLLMLASALLVLKQVDWLERSHGRQIAQDLPGYLSRLLDRQWQVHPLADPTTSEAWGELVYPLTTALDGQPYLVGLVVRGPSGRVLARVGQVGADLGRALAQEEGQDLVVADLPGGGLGVAFAWHRPADPGGPSVRVQAALMVPTKERARARVHTFMISGAVLLTLVIYLLAALAILMTRAQSRLMNRASERGGRLAAVAKVAGGIAHEVRNPLNAISLMLQYLERKVRKTQMPPEASDYARIHLELGKIRKVVDNFVRFARARELEVAQVDLGQLTGSVLERFSPSLAEARVALDLETSGNLICAVDEDKIREVLEAVLTNSLEAMRDHDQGSLSVRVVGAKQQVKVAIRDTGDVLDERQARSIFEPYLSTRDNAMGLGLTVARTLVESHGGSIEAHAAQGGGCVVTITLQRRFF